MDTIWKKTPTYLRLNILDFIGDSPSTLFAKRFKKEPQKTAKEKRAEKREKKANRG